MLIIIIKIAFVFSIYILNIQSYYVDNLYENIDINILKSLNRINPMTNKKNYIIIEEIDTISNSVLDEIVKDINNIHVPIICISNTNYKIYYG